MAAHTTLSINAAVHHQTPCSPLTFNPSSTSLPLHSSFHGFSVKFTTQFQSLSSAVAASTPKSLTVVAATRKAFAVLKGSSSVEGVVTLTQDDEGPKTVSVRVAGLAPGKHGFHLHEYGDTTNGCISTGAHLIPRD